MPRSSFDALPDDARVWIFGSDKPVTGERATQLLDAVDGFLDRWQAHGSPLTCARDWRDDRFLVIGVDERGAGASGCSIDGLFRVLGALEAEIGATLRGSGRVFWRGASGDVTSASRPDFRSAAARGEITNDTPVFDTTVTTAADYRRRFERKAADSWHGQLVRS